MAYYNHQSVGSGFVNLPNQNQTSVYDVANQGLGVFENLLKFSKARREEQEDQGFRLFSSVVSEYGQKVKGLENDLGPNDPIVRQKRQALDQLTSKLYQDQQDIVAGRKRKMDVIRDPLNNQLISQLVSPIGEEGLQRQADVKEGKLKGKQLREGYSNLAERSVEKKNELKRILAGQPTMTEEARAGAAQMTGRGAGAGAFGLNDVLGPQEARTQNLQQTALAPEILTGQTKEERGKKLTWAEIKGNAESHGLVEGKDFKKSVNANGQVVAKPINKKDSIPEGLSKDTAILLDEIDQKRAEQNKPPKNMKETFAKMIQNIKTALNEGDSREFLKMSAEDQENQIERALIDRGISLDDLTPQARKRLTLDVRNEIIALREKKSKGKDKDAVSTGIQNRINKKLGKTSGV